MINPFAQGWRYVKTLLGLIFRHPLVGTTIVPVLPDGRVVLVRRRDDGRWALPGGLVDWGEDLAAAAGRELAEETGLELEALGRLVGVYSSPDRDPRLHSICIVVEARAIGQPRVRDTLEIAEVRAFPPDALPEGPFSHDHDRQLRDYFEGRTALA